MPHLLKNENLEVHIDDPLENYNFSRFDWTGKIVKVKFQDIAVSTIESPDYENKNHFGKGFYNEFGIDTALGYDEAKTGDWFHKIGVGLLKKDDESYLFSKAYEIQPAEFTTSTEPNKIIITCRSQAVNGYAYLLTKEIELLESGFVIRYHLENSGEKAIRTDEYTHNFLAINNDLMGRDYILKFPFQLQPQKFDAAVNPGEKIDIGGKGIQFNSAPDAQFFFSNLSGGETIDSDWELINRKRNIAIRETTSFQTDKINLWGWQHVISPELFHQIAISPGQSAQWFRQFDVSHYSESAFL